MRAAVVTAPGTIEVTTVNDPTPGPKDVVIEVAAVGICGTDLHILEGNFAPSLPIIPGHEFSGTVVAVGSKVTGFPIGAKVAADPNLPCHACRYCRAGRSNLCDSWSAIGISEPGAMAEYVAVPAANCVRLPEYLRLEDAALIEPLSCAIRGYDVLRSRLGSHVLIYGAGTMGLMMLQLAKLTGAATVDVLDTNPDRAGTAAVLGCTGVSDSADNIERPGGWDVVIDATGNAKAIQDALSRVTKGGTYLQFGVADEDTKVSIEPYRIYNQEITITGSMAVLHSYERAAELFATGIIPAELFISHRHPLEHTAEAFDLFKAGGSRKAQIMPTLTKKA
jgi:2-desacetyl-2-hydroxyethyl bacteriochlorophyllide A dehydrogenase